jgi:hypothetical protein
VAPGRRLGPVTTTGARSYGLGWVIVSDQRQSSRRYPSVGHELASHASEIRAPTCASQTFTSCDKCVEPTDPDVSRHEKTTGTQQVWPSVCPLLCPHLSFHFNNFWPFRARDTPILLKMEMERKEKGGVPTILPGTPFSGLRGVEFTFWCSSVSLGFKHL